MQIEAKVTVKAERIWCAFVGAFEGASTYWVHSAKLVAREGTPADPRLVWWGDEKLYEGKYSFTIRYDDPDQVEGNGAGVKTLNQDDVAAGVQKMATGSPSHFADLISEADDATTHDVLLQYIVLGEVVYG